MVADWVAAAMVEAMARLPQVAQEAQEETTAMVLLAQMEAVILGVEMAAAVAAATMVEALLVEEVMVIHSVVAVLVAAQDAKEARTEMVPMCMGPLGVEPAEAAAMVRIWVAVVVAMVAMLLLVQSETALLGVEKAIRVVASMVVAMVAMLGTAGARAANVVARLAAKLADPMGATQETILEAMGNVVAGATAGMTGDAMAEAMAGAMAKGPMETAVSGGLVVVA